MKAEPNASLESLNTLGVAAHTALLLTIETEEDVLSAPGFNPASDVILGGGSNVVFATDVPGTVFLNQIRGIDIVERDNDHLWIEVGAGESWHELVLWSLEQGLSGLENLSLIPGLAGAAPVQNIGAYGVELSSVLHSVTTWDTAECRWAVFDRDQCQLSYRDSRFKSDPDQRHLITSIRLRLNRRFQPQLSYRGLVEELHRHRIERPNARQVSDAVIRLRQRKLPDPALEGNAGSFFKNPVVSQEQSDQLLSRFPDLANWRLENGQVKLSAAWMIESCGLKGFRQGDAGVSEKHSLVLVNHGQASGAQIMNLASSVKKRIHEKFGVLLEQEPVLIEF